MGFCKQRVTGSHWPDSGRTTPLNSGEQCEPSPSVCGWLSGVPQAASAADTLYGFVSVVPGGPGWAAARIRRLGLRVPAEDAFECPGRDLRLVVWFP
jgi:hypothetical protein